MAKWKELEFSISQVRFSTSNSTIQGCGEDQGWLPCAGSMIGASMMSSLIPTEALGGEWHSLSSARVPWIVRGQGFGIQVLLPGTHVTQLPRVPYHTIPCVWGGFFHGRQRHVALCWFWEGLFTALVHPYPASHSTPHPSALYPLLASSLCSVFFLIHSWPPGDSQLIIYYLGMAEEEDVCLMKCQSSR